MFAKFVCFSLLFVASLGYPTGAPVDVCDTMYPGHGTGAQTKNSPYSVQVSQKRTPVNSEVTLTIKAAPEENFKGFQLQVRDASDQAVGEFIIAANDQKTQAQKCFERENSSATHINKDPVNSVSLNWKAPSTTGTYKIVLTTVKTFKEFWVKQDAGTIEVY